MGLLNVFKPRTARQLTGQAGEDDALAHLQRHGLCLKERNFLCKGGEIDLVMMECDTLVFVEVRKRAASQFGGAAASITNKLLGVGRVQRARHVLFPQRLKAHKPSCCCKQTKEHDATIN